MRNNKSAVFVLLPLPLVVASTSVVSASEVAASRAVGNNAVISVVTQKGDVESRSLNPLADYDPMQQPEIYWHDSDYQIELQRPYREQHPYMITILPRVGVRKEVAVTTESDPLSFGEIVSVTRAPDDKALVMAHSDSIVDGFSVIDLRTGRLIDTVYGYSTTASPDSRFVVFTGLYPRRSPNPVESHYRLYDLLKKPEDNSCCGHTKLLGPLEDWRGQAIYPVKSGKICRPPEDPDASGDTLHWGVSDAFVWSFDSKAVVFADTQGGVVSVILVTMPKTSSGGASSFTYTLPNQKACEKDCPKWGPVHLTWLGDTINATLEVIPFGGKRQMMSIALRESDFTPAPR